MNPGRRRALRVLAGTGAATATVAAAPAHAARAPKLKWEKPAPWSEAAE